MSRPFFVPAVANICHGLKLQRGDKMGKLDQVFVLAAFKLDYHS